MRRRLERHLSTLQVLLRLWLRDSSALCPRNCQRTTLGEDALHPPVRRARGLLRPRGSLTHIVSASPHANFTVGFDSTGPRIPAVLISPWVLPHTAYNSSLDHTSILQLLAERFDSAPYSAGVDARRAAGIGSVSQALNPTLGYRPPPPLPTINLSTSVILSTTKPATSKARQAFASAVDQFATTQGKSALLSYPSIAQWLASR